MIQRVKKKIVRKVDVKSDQIHIHQYADRIDSLNVNQLEQLISEMEHELKTKLKSFTLIQIGEPNAELPLKIDNIKRQYVVYLDLKKSLDPTLSPLEKNKAILRPLLQLKQDIDLKLSELSSLMFEPITTLKKTIEEKLQRFETAHEELLQRLTTTPKFAETYPAITSEINELKQKYEAVSNAYETLLMDPNSASNQNANDILDLYQKLDKKIDSGLLDIEQEILKVPLLQTMDDLTRFNQDNQPLIRHLQFLTPFRQHFDPKLKELIDHYLDIQHLHENLTTNWSDSKTIKRLQTQILSFHHQLQDQANQDLVAHELDRIEQLNIHFQKSNLN